MQVEVGQLRRWHNSPSNTRARRAGKMFIVLSQRKTFVDDGGVAHVVKDLAWNYLGSRGEEWQWDDVLVRCSEVVSG